MIDGKPFYVVVFAVLIFSVAISALYIKFTERRCHSLWDISGIPVRWDISGGCQIDPQRNGLWIPAWTYRSGK